MQTKNSMTLDRISAFLTQNPDLKVFNRETAHEILFLLFEIERAMTLASASRLQDITVTSLVREFYSSRDLANLEVKVSTFMKAMLEDLQLLRDFYENNTRFFLITGSGKELIHLVQTRTSSSPRFSGLAVEQLVENITTLADYNTPISLEEKIKDLQDERNRISDLISRLEAGDEDAILELKTQSSPEELLSEAERNAQNILLAGEDVKKDLKKSREEVLLSQEHSKFKAGKTIKLSAQYNNQIQSKPTYLSHIRAKDTFSHIEALSSKNPYKDIGKALRRIQKTDVISSARLGSSPLWSFQKQYEAQCRDIANEQTNNLRILEAQVRATTSVDGKKLTEDLKDLTSILVKNAQSADGFLNDYKVEYASSVTADIGTLKLNPYSIYEKIVVDAPILTTPTEADLAATAKALKESEEKRLSTYLNRLKKKIKEKGHALLSEEDFKEGFTEFYVYYLANYLDDGIDFEYMSEQPVKYLIRNKFQPYLITSLRDRRMFLKAKEKSI